MICASLECCRHCVFCGCCCCCRGVLIVDVRQAVDLPPGDWDSGDSDPYVLLKVGAVLASIGLSAHQRVHCLVCWDALSAVGCSGSTIITLLYYLSATTLPDATEN